MVVCLCCRVVLHGEGAREEPEGDAQTLLSGDAGRAVDSRRSSQTALPEHRGDDQGSRSVARTITQCP